MKEVARNTVLLMFSFFMSYGTASELEIPHTFETGQVTSATEMNANFEAIKAAVNDNHNRISEPRTQFVGFSTERVAGNLGLFGMQQACDVLVADSHMCDTSEFSGSSYNGTAIGTIEENDVAWIRIRAGGFNDGRTIIDENAIAHVYSTSYPNENASCGGWRSIRASDRAIIVYANGSMGSQSCNIEAKVACCK